MLVGAMFFAGVLVMALLNPRESATTARASSDASSTPMPTPRRYHSAENLRAYYQKLMSEINPHLNFITTALVKVKGGYALYAYHDFFSEFTFSVGDDAKAVATFTNVYQDDLRQAKIVRVGVSGKGEFASGKYFEVK